MTKRMLVVAGLALGMCGFAGAQAPAGAPAGSNGICKDGTYSTAASKQGACRGHKGVQTWYVAEAAAPAKAGAAAMPAPKPAPAAAPAMPAPKPAATPAAMPAPKAAPAAPAAMPAPAPAAAAKSKAGPAAAAAAKTQAAGGGPGLVWVNTESNVYHCNGDTYYGKTKAGAYMSEADAKAKGARGERGKSCAGK